MKLFWIVYFASCMVVIGVKLRNYVKSKKKINRQEAEPATEESTPQNFNERKKEDLQFTLESVNSWLNNCDQKAGILLTVVGVAITVLVTSDFLKNLRNYIFKPFMDYWEENQVLSFSWSRFTVFVMLCVAVILLLLTCYYLFRAITANINYTKMYQENPGLVKTSKIFYGTISEMTYDDFKKDDMNYIEDLKSQIYVNSKIAIIKFKNYNEGLYWFKFLLLVSVLLFIAIMFMK
ncbi:hypothetical protein [Xylanibacter ruminicola]|uniref:Pycsar effector protein domain-containing protein n=1 Tax=Xylanibacter ruminicola TaxID=839 RepID=A0A1M6R1L3_XYLRU|nr:hypothetical protein [Xylanibacter ruminicola]SHK26342.1 hypothetical protein SAMN05216463_10138 [Xylanibacter ruminicola]